MLELGEKPLTPVSAVSSAGGNPDADGHDRSGAGLRWQALRPPASPGRSRRAWRCPSVSWREPVIRRDSRPGLVIMRQAHV